MLKKSKLTIDQLVFLLLNLLLKHELKLILWLIFFDSDLSIENVRINPLL